MQKQIVIPAGKFSEKEINIKVVDKISLKEEKTASIKVHLKKVIEKKTTKAKRYKIRITKKGEKGSWWNKLIDNYFVADSVDDGENFTIRYLSDSSGARAKVDGFERLKISKEFCLYWGFESFKN